MRLSLVIFVVCYSTVVAQPVYTKLRGAFGMEAWGIAPVAMVSVDMPFLYKPKGFFNFQIGIGKTGASPLLVPSLATAITYSFFLNQKHRNVCEPQPSRNKLEAYLELGPGLTILQSSYGGLPKAVDDSGDNFYPSALMGIRLHYIDDRWIYILKFRLTPFLDRKFAAWGGVQIGLGWR